MNKKKLKSAATLGLGHFAYPKKSKVRWHFQGFNEVGKETFFGFVEKGSRIRPSIRKEYLIEFTVRTKMSFANIDYIISNIKYGTMRMYGADGSLNETWDYDELELKIINSYDVFDYDILMDYESFVYTDHLKGQK